MSEPTARRVTFLERGPWDDEPDDDKFVHAELACQIHRQNYPGTLCGYVAVPKAHPYYGKQTMEVTSLNAHGGITYAEHNTFGHPVTIAYAEKKAASVTGISPSWYKDMANWEREHAGEPKSITLEGMDLWWFGFDCSHLYDYQPATPESVRGFGWREPGQSYADWQYVRREVELLAEQLAAMMPMPTLEEAKP